MLIRPLWSNEPSVSPLCITSECDRGPRCQQYALTSLERYFLKMKAGGQARRDEGSIMKPRQTWRQEYARRKSDQARRIIASQWQQKVTVGAKLSWQHLHALYRKKSRCDPLFKSSKHNRTTVTWKSILLIINAIIIDLKGNICAWSHNWEWGAIKQPIKPRAENVWIKTYTNTAVTPCRSLSCTLFCHIQCSMQEQRQAVYRFLADHVEQHGVFSKSK